MPESDDTSSGELSLAEQRDETVDRIREELARLVRDSRRTQRWIERQNGFQRGYLSQVLSGHITLTLRHVIGVVLALGVAPERFLAAAFGATVPEMPMGEIREKMARYDAALLELTERGLLSPTGVVPVERARAHASKPRGGS